MKLRVWTVRIAAAAKKMQGLTAPWHFHDSAEIFYVSAGRFWMKFEEVFTQAFSCDDETWSLRKISGLASFPHKYTKANILHLLALACILAKTN